MTQQQPPADRDRHDGDAVAGDRPLRAEPYLGESAAEAADSTDPYRSPDPYRPSQGSAQQPPAQQAPYGQGHYQQGGYQPGFPVPGQPPISEADARLWSTLGHVGVIVTGFIAPLIIWAVFKDRSQLIRENAGAATNFGILMTIASVIGGILSIIGIGVLIILAAWVLAVVFGIIGATRANRGEVYRYPFNVTWVK